jgi:hypothetical protein
MRIHLPNIGTAVIVTVLAMGVLGMFVFIPIACIQWTWNSVMTSFPLLPLINAWQAMLLYLALASGVYLTGAVRIEFEPDTLD